jgi:hypothetical protein
MLVESAARENALRFVGEHGRPLDKALLATRSGRKDAVENVWRELAKFQNPDGGFGSALEPDFRCQASSAVATSLAFQVFRRCNASIELPMCAKAVDYLLDSLDAKHDKWLPVPSDLDSAPHAPWWRFKAAEEAPFINPGVELVGYLWDYASCVPAGLLQRLTEKAMAELETAPPEMEMHDFLCYVRLIETRTLPCDVKAKLLHLLSEASKRIVVLDEEGWAKYGLKPLTFIESPASPFAATYADAVQNNIRYELKQQDADGSWRPAWKWGDDDVWKRVEGEWRSILTLRMITILENFKA